MNYLPFWEVVGSSGRKKERARERKTRVSPSCAPALSWACKRRKGWGTWKRNGKGDWGERERTLCDWHYLLERTCCNQSNPPPRVKGNCEDAVYAVVCSRVCVKSENRVEEITYFGPLMACHIVQISGNTPPSPHRRFCATQAERQKLHPCLLHSRRVVTRGTALRDDTKTAV